MQRRRVSAPRSRVQRQFSDLLVLSTVAVTGEGIALCKARE